MKGLPAWAAGVVLALQVSACGPPTTAPPDAGSWWETGPLKACAAVGGVAPDSIDATVTRLNVLPKPTTVACFLASLPRPLRLVATRSIQSAQPAAGARSPRVFLMSPTLILSVVPDGAGATLLEFGEFTTGLDTIKAELAFPLDAGLAASAPYEGLNYSGNLTKCGLCHRNEVSHATIPNAYVSAAFRPEDTQAVSIEALKKEFEGCDVAAEPARCELLAALFGFGEVKQGVFPRTLDRFLP